MPLPAIAVTSTLTGWVSFSSYSGNFGCVNDNLFVQEGFRLGTCVAVEKVSSSLTGIKSEGGSSFKIVATEFISPVTTAAAAATAYNYDYSRSTSGPPAGTTSSSSSSNHSTDESIENAHNEHRNLVAIRLFKYFYPTSTNCSSIISNSNSTSSRNSSGSSSAGTVSITEVGQVGKCSKSSSSSSTSFSSFHSHVAAASSYWYFSFNYSSDIESHQQLLLRESNNILLPGHIHWGYEDHKQCSSPSSSSSSSSSSSLPTGTATASASPYGYKYIRSNSCKEFSSGTFSSCYYTGRTNSSSSSNGFVTGSVFERMACTGGGGAARGGRHADRSNSNSSSSTSDSSSTSSTSSRGAVSMKEVFNKNLKGEEENPISTSSAAATEEDRPHIIIGKKGGDEVEAIDSTMTLSSIPGIQPPPAPPTLVVPYGRLQGESILSLASSSSSSSNDNTLPSAKPTATPTAAPSAFPTIVPTAAPTHSPTYSINVDYGKGKAAVVFISCLVFTILFGLVTFLAVDAAECHTIAFKNEAEGKRKRVNVAWKLAEIAEEQERLQKLLQLKFQPELEPGGRADHHQQQQGGIVILPGSINIIGRLLVRLQQWFCGGVLKKPGHQNNHIDIEIGAEILALSHPTKNTSSGNNNTSKENNNNKSAAKITIDVSKGVSKKSSSYRAALMYEFLDKVFPEDFLLKRRQYASVRTLEVIFRNHPYTAMLAGPSVANTRTMRWITLVRFLVVALFVDTMVFSIFYPTSGVCEEHNNTSSTTCETTHSIVTSRLSLCVYQVHTGVCSVRPPPANNTALTFVIALLTLAIVTPIEFVLSSLQGSVARKRPRPISQGLFCKSSSPASRRKGAAAGARSPPPLHREGDEEVPPPTSPASSIRAGGRQKSSITIKRNARGAPLDELLGRLPLVDLTDDYLFDYATTDDEVDGILSAISQYFSLPLLQDIETGGGGGGTEGGGAAGAGAGVGSCYDSPADHTAKIHAIREFLGMYSNGSSAPLSWRQRWIYNNPRDRILKKIEKAREQAQVLEDRINQLGDKMEHKDITLIQQYVLDCLPPMKRFVLRHYFFEFDDLPPEEVGVVPWLFAWTIILGSLGFFIYWIYRWALVNSGETLSVWGKIYAIQVAQDILAGGLLKIYLIEVLGVESARPQLRAIYATLCKIAMQNKIKKRIRKDERQFAVSQHLLTSCRASRLAGIHDLPAAKLLQQIDDIDLAHCRQDRTWHIGPLSLFLFIVPAALLLFNDAIADYIIDGVLHGIVTAFLIANAELYSTYGALAEATPYIIIGGIIFCTVFLYRPARRRGRILHIKKQRDQEQQRKTKRLVLPGSHPDFPYNPPWMQSNRASATTTTTAVTISAAAYTAAATAAGSAPSGGPLRSSAISTPNSSTYKKSHGSGIRSGGGGLRVRLFLDERVEQFKDNNSGDNHHQQQQQVAGGEGIIPTANYQMEANPSLQPNKPSDTHGIDVFHMVFGSGMHAHTTLDEDILLARKSRRRWWWCHLCIRAATITLNAISTAVYYSSYKERLRRIQAERSVDLEWLASNAVPVSRQRSTAVRSRNISLRTVEGSQGPYKDQLYAPVPDEVLTMMLFLAPSPDHQYNYTPAAPTAPTAPTNAANAANAAAATALRWGKRKTDSSRGRGSGFDNFFNKYFFNLPPLEEGKEEGGQPVDGKQQSPSKLQLLPYTQTTTVNNKGSKFDGSFDAQKIFILLEKTLPKRGADGLMVTATVAECLHNFIEKFHPAGVKLKPEEIEEIDGLFESWAETSACTVELIEYSVFRDWFIDDLSVTINRAAKHRLEPVKSKQVDPALDPLMMFGSPPPSSQKRRSSSRYGDSTGGDSIASRDSEDEESMWLLPDHLLSGTAGHGTGNGLGSNNLGERVTSGGGEVTGGGLIGEHQQPPQDSAAGTGTGGASTSAIAALSSLDNNRKLVGFTPSKSPAQWFDIPEDGDQLSSIVQHVDVLTYANNHEKLL